MGACAQRATDRSCLEQVRGFLQPGMEAELVANQHAAAALLYCSSKLSNAFQGMRNGLFQQQMAAEARAPEWQPASAGRWGWRR